MDSMPTAQRKLTFPELVALPGDPRRELIDGEVHVSPSPSLRHQDIVLRLGSILRDHAVGHVYIAPVDVVLAADQVLQPDIVFVARDGVAELRGNHISGPPDLVVEVVSDSRMDRVRKRDLYERHGVPEYWVVDAEADRVEIHRLTGAGYGKPQILDGDDTLTTPALPGLRVDLAAVFER